MQRSAAKQLTRLVTCPLHRHYTLFMNSTELRHLQLLHFQRFHQSLQKLAIASPFTLLRGCIHLSMLIRYFSNASHMPSLVVHDSEGLPCTHQTIKDRNHIHVNDDRILKEAVDNDIGQFLSENAHLNQEEKTDLEEEGQAVSSLSSTETKGQLDATYMVSHGLLTDSHCIQLLKDGKGDELLPSSEVAMQLQGNELKDCAVLEGLLSFEVGMRHDLGEASSTSGTISCAGIAGDVKESNVKVLDSQSPSGKAVWTDLSEACINQSFEQKFDNTNGLSVDALSVVCILDKFGWGSYTESILQKFIGSITPELVTNVVDLQKNVKVAFLFLKWAGKHEKFQYREEIFTKVVGRLGKELHFELAWKVLEYMRSHGLKVDYAFGIFIHRLRSANMVDEVILAMESMVRLDVIPTIPLFTVALQLILKANKLEGARRLYKQMRQERLQPDTKLFGILISGFGSAGQVDDALSFFREMQRDQVPPDSFIYTSLIRAFAAAGKFCEGQTFYTEMIQNTCLPMGLSRLDLECALYGVRSMEEIQRFLESLEIRGHKISIYTYNNMLQHLVDKNLHLEAVEVFCQLSVETHESDSHQSMDKQTTRCNIDSYSVLIAGLCKGGHLTEALLLFKHMMVNGFRPTSETCNRLLHSLSSNEGYMFEALELSRHIARVKLMVDFETQKTFFQALYDGGDLSKALKIFESMKWRGCIDPASDFYAVIGVAR